MHYGPSLGLQACSRQDWPEFINLKYTIPISPKPGHENSDKPGMGNSIFRVDLCSLMFLTGVGQYGSRKGMWSVN